MDNIVKVSAASGMKLMASLSRQLPSQRRYGTNARDDKNTKAAHPYRTIHPWKSLNEFTKSLIAGVVYNEDGLVAINKPYGISSTKKHFEQKKPTGIVNDVDYTLSDAIPEIAETFGFADLKLIKCPEKFTSGIALLGADDKVKKAVEIALRRATAMRLIPQTYWIVTTRVPNKIKDEMRLAMRMQKDPTGQTQLPVVETSWSHNDAKRRNIKNLNVQYKVISNSSGNLSSLVEIRSSTAKWHALRLFASTVLYSPILGDNIYGSRVKNVMGTWMNISPFVDAARELPRLNIELLTKLRLSKGKEILIPTHIHLRDIYLPMFKNKVSDLVLTAPPMPEFKWTCQQLEFKHDMFKIEDSEEICMDWDSNTRKNEAMI